VITAPNRRGFVNTKSSAIKSDLTLPQITDRTIEMKPQLSISPVLNQTRVFKSTTRNPAMEKFHRHKHEEFLTFLNKKKIEVAKSSKKLSIATERNRTET
jgi:hypothetical protein